jgi:hypothetical protein
MKLKLISTLTLFCVFFSVHAQTKKKSGLFIDSTARKHELQLNVGMLAGTIFSLGFPNSSAFDITYARVYHGTHYLRTGIGLSTYRSNNNNGIENIADLGLPDTINYHFNQGNSTTMAWAKVGYEVSVGKRKTRFLFGSDLMLGYVTENSHKKVTTGNEPYNWENAVYINQLDYRGILVGINPRASVRYNFSKLFAGGITMGVFAGGFFHIKERVWNGTGELPGFRSTALGGFDLRLKPELNLIFKIPSKKV